MIVSNASQQTDDGTTNHMYAQRAQATSYAANVARSMTIGEMRQLHRGALAEAEAKDTELRLVLASRYRELVGSSDEVMHMQKRAVELDGLVGSLPSLVGALLDSNDRRDALDGLVMGTTVNDFQDSATVSRNVSNRSVKISIDPVKVAHWKLSRAPRVIHRHLDRGDVHGAATALVDIFSLISSYTNVFPLANELSSAVMVNPITQIMDRRLAAQLKMVFLHVQTLPSRTVRLCKRLLLIRSSSSSFSSSPTSSSLAYECSDCNGVEVMASALSAINLLDVGRRYRTVDGDDGENGRYVNESQRAVRLVDMYYESKAKLIHDLLGQLSTPGSGAGGKEKDKDKDGIDSNSTMAGKSNYYTPEATDKAEKILSKIVFILQYDIILHPYQIFCLRRFVCSIGNGKNTVDCNNNQRGGTEKELERERHIISSLPKFDPDLLKNKASNFLAAHLPLIRTKVKSVLMAIAGTTASRLGHIRQSLYDKTDGIECRKDIDSNGLCTWDEAVNGVVDLKIVMHGLEGSSSLLVNTTTINGSKTSTSTPASSSSTAHPGRKRFSLWGTLFSNTFSSLVHSLLATSFHSVHSRVVSTLRASLANAPPSSCILPHEAHRNASQIANDLDSALRRVGDDAHELLVHAEEREESQRRLRQSLYVQTCEIMGRLLNELRRMLLDGTTMSSLEVLHGNGKGMQQRRYSSSPSPSSIGWNDGDKIGRDATRELIVGRLCYLLKFRLTSLPILLDPESSPAVLSVRSSSTGLVQRGGKHIQRDISGVDDRPGKGGMITLAELRSSFEIADDDEDGLISFDEAMEAMEGAFSGTQFRGAEMVSETMLLSSSTVTSSDKKDGGDRGSSSIEVIRSGGIGNAIDPPRNVTLSELALLSARGLKHESTGLESALGTVQRSLDCIVQTCFTTWATVVLQPFVSSLQDCTRQWMDTACNIEDQEWRRLHHLLEKETKSSSASLENREKIKKDNMINIEEKQIQQALAVGNVSPHFLSYLLSVASVLNQSICPSDSLSPVSSLDCASAMGIELACSSSTPLIHDDCKEDELTMLHIIRGSLLNESFKSLINIFEKEILTSSINRVDKEEQDSVTKIKLCGPTSLLQLYLDNEFVLMCFYERNKIGFIMKEISECNFGEKGNVSSGENFVEQSKKMLEQIGETVFSEINVNHTIVNKDTLLPVIRERYLDVVNSCNLFLCT